MELENNGGGIRFKSNEAEEHFTDTTLQIIRVNIWFRVPCSYPPPPHGMVPPCFGGGGVRALPHDFLFIMQWPRGDLALWHAPGNQEVIVLKRFEQDNAALGVGAIFIPQLCHIIRSFCLGDDLDRQLVLFDKFADGPKG